MSIFRIPVGRGRVALLGLGLVGVLLSLACPASRPAEVLGPSTVGNEVPFMEFLSPTDNLSVNRGESFDVSWRDSDTDSAAIIKLEMVETETGLATVIIDGIQENDLIGPDNWPIDTTLLVETTYYIRGTISDGLNVPYVTYALTSAGAGNRVVVTVTPPGLAPSNTPPQIVVLEPQFNQSVAQDDSFVVTVAPVPPAQQTNPATIPYDPDSPATIYIVADLDERPDNDDVKGPDPDELILLRTITVDAGATDPQTLTIVVDLTTLPPRPNGEPYYIRATIDDGTNELVHSYATGTLNVVRSAQGAVYLEDVGKTLAGARWIGFNPYSWLGTTIEGVGDFDADGVDDMVLVAQYGNPRNYGNIGEAYLIYGLNRVRFGNTINVNSVSSSISGTLFEGPPPLSSYGGTTMGITDVGVIEDFNGDQRPELLFGLAHVDGSIQQRDMDPDDPNDFIPGCYPDPYANNLGDEADDDYPDANGFAVVLNSENRDADPAIADATRLEDTSVVLELVGQGGDTLLFYGKGFYDLPTLAAVPDNGMQGLRVQAGPFDTVDHLFLQQPPLQGWFGLEVASMPDLNNDGNPELIFSAPRNEQDILDTLANFGSFATHLTSRRFFGSIIIIDASSTYFDPGSTWGSVDTSATIIPSSDGGGCTTPPPRILPIPFDSFEIYAEDPEDFLHDGSFAGDFNLDSVPDILCGAPFNDRLDTKPETGVTYVVYGRRPVDDYFLELADNQQFRPPMIRIRGDQPYDRVGWIQKQVADVNGDRIDDIVLGAPYADFGGVEPTICDGDWDANGRVDNTDLGAFNGCRASYGDEVFYDDECKLFDFNNDRQIDDDDRRVMDCLIAGGFTECCPSDNGFAAVVFGGITLDGDRNISQIATSDLPGVRFTGTSPGDLAGWDVSSAGDFNRDGYGDILIAVPGERVTDDAGRPRLGTAYLIFGGPHLQNGTFVLAQVGTDNLPGLKLISPFERGRPDEAPIETVSGIGDINNDAFDDIGVGIPRADFVDESFPQGSVDPGSDPEVGRRTDDGSIYIIYGSNVGTNR